MAKFFVKLWYRTDKVHIDFVAGFSSQADFEKQASESYNSSIGEIYEYIKSKYENIGFSDDIEADLIEYEINEVSEFLDISK